MNAGGWARLQYLFHRAEELPPEQREDFLDGACAREPELAKQVQSLLAASADSEILAAPLGEISKEMGAGRWSSGDRVGSYRIVSELGRGGMGTVFLAERADGVFEQQVALKIVLGVFASPSAVARFLAERRILARLEHPNIARLLDGGTTPEGAPYFVMERVEGEPIDRFCDRRRLSIRERLQLFATVCDAVRYAHRNLVVHRDLKPSNILVTADGVPKLLDFGIGKLLDPNDDPEGLTRRGELPMTPEYASPEQVRGGPVSVSSDVYALGLLLYELLTGRRAQRLDSRERSEIERAVCERPATRPSTAVGRIPSALADGDASPDELAAARSTTPRGLRRRLRGDLDTIVVVALRKEPEQRYGSVEALAEDVCRHLDGLPVRARGDRLVYRVGKFVRRHRTGVAAAVLAASSLSAAAAFSTYGLLRALAAEAEARREAATSEQVADFLASVFKLSDPRQSKGEEVSVRAALDRGADRIELDLAGQPRVQAELMDVLGRTYMEIGELDAAQNLLRRALELRRRHLGPDHPDLAETLRHLGLHWHQRGEYGRAEAPYLEAVEILERSLGEDALELGAVLNNLGNLYKRTGEYQLGVAAFERALAIRELHLGPGAVDVAKVVNNQGALLYTMGEDERARPLYERALAIYERELGPDHPMVAGTLGNLALVRQRMGDYKGLERVFRRVLAIQRKAYGPSHAKVATALNSLGAFLAVAERHDEAAEVFDESAHVYRKALGSEHPYVAYPLFNLGDLYLATSRPARAVPYFRQAAEIRAAALGSDHPLLAGCLEGLGRAQAELGETGMAEEDLRRALAIRRRTHATGGEALATSLLHLGRLLATTGRCTEAVQLLEEAAGLPSRGATSSDSDLAEIDDLLTACASVLPSNP